MTRHRMEGERKAQAQNRADKESTKDHLLLPVDLPCWSNEEVDGRADEHDAAEQMSPGKFIASQAIRGRRDFAALTKCCPSPCGVERWI